MRCTQRFGSALLLAGVLHAGGAPAAAQSPADSARALHLLSRATWGARPADVAAVLAKGPTAWLDRQLNPSKIPDAGLEQRLKLLPTITMSSTELFRDFTPVVAEIQAQRAAMRDSADAMMAAQTMTAEERRERQARNPQRLLNELVTAKLQRSVYSERQLEDVMTDFWFNHFNVFFNKGQDRYLVGDYERSVIRPNVFGKFEDLLIATAQHPAMLFYLDNWQSVYVDSTSGGPGVRVARARGRGLNENYARELLELHTLGVDGGYTQKDVIEVARALTGWSYEPPNIAQLQSGQTPRVPPRQRFDARNGRNGDVRGKGDIPFVFRAQLHDPGEKVVLGKVLPAGRGIQDGLDVMHIVATHPSTARFVATKLVERFVSDRPPEDLVDHLATVFRETDGDLRAVTRALFLSEDFYRAEYRHAKVKTPYELVVSAARATGAEVSLSRRTMELLRGMGHLPYTEAAPTGFPAMSEDWVNSGAMLNRMNFGLDHAAGRVDGVRIDASFLPREDRAIDVMLARVLPGINTSRLGDRIREDLAAQSDLTPRTRLVRALGLALGSPEFQRR